MEKINMENQLIEIVNALKYFRAIHVMGILLIGIGFLMSFIKNHERSTLIVTYLVTSMTIPFYYMINTLGIFGSTFSKIDRLIGAEFAAAALLLATGVIIGRLKMNQYLLMSVIFIPCYAFNEWILFSGGLNLLLPGVVLDTGGSIFVHLFGALFGTAVAFTMTTREEYETPIKVDALSERFSMFGSLFLWVFYPSFCAALVAPKDIPTTVVNVIMALSGSTLAAYITSVKFRGKLSVSDIANGALAGGGVVGASCNLIDPFTGFMMGVIGGLLATFGFIFVQKWLQKTTKTVDSCGVFQLHALPGLAGGILAIFVVDGINKGEQIKGILITVLLAILFGFLTGKAVSILGRRKAPYMDSEELEVT
jgi:ammonium transporter Rh